MKHRSSPPLARWEAVPRSMTISAWLAGSGAVSIISTGTQRGDTLWHPEVRPAPTDQGRGAAECASLCSEATHLRAPPNPAVSSHARNGSRATAHSQLAEAGTRR
jgi:hypothetical protein